MPHSKSPPFLTILIPTRNRADLLQEALQLMTAAVVDLNAPGTVEIVCADNWSTDDTPHVVRKVAERHPFVRYERQPFESPSAEVSLALGVDFARGTYVWSFGDDDKPLGDAFPSLLDALSVHNPDFLLLNAKIDVGGPRLLDYFSAEQPFVPFKNGLALFRQFGLVSAMTTISCLCFKREFFDVARALEFSKSAQIYSHTAALLCMFYDRNAAFLSTPLLVYTQHQAPILAAQYTEWCHSRGQCLESVFTVGIIALLKHVHEVIGLSLGTLAIFEEVELRKDNWRIQHSLLWVFICRHALSRQLYAVSNTSEFRLSYDLPIIADVLSFLLIAKRYDSFMAACLLLLVALATMVLAGINRLLPVEQIRRASARMIRVMISVSFRFLSRAERNYFTARKKLENPDVLSYKFYFSGNNAEKPVFYE